MDPTARGDLIASIVRAWYERNRESWWDRNKPIGADRSGEHAGEFMLRFIAYVRKIDALSDTELTMDYP
jgi:hypothetical protein